MRSATAQPPTPLDRWFPSRKPLPEARARLFCFPFAGGSASIYNGWTPTTMPPGVEVCAVQLPGRERRLMEPPINAMPTLVDALLPVMSPLLDKPFVFFGYSMGARIALEVARRLQAKGGPVPRGFIASAAPPPSANDRDPIHHLDNAGFIDKLRSYDGTPEEILQHRELLELVLPTLRADFALAWWENGPNPVKLNLPISVLGGTGDKHVKLATLEQWRNETSGEVHVRHFDGGHFFIRSHANQVLTAVREDLDRWLPAAPTA